MVKVACLMMQRDENQLLDAWLAYHGALFGSENLFVWDNGSTDQATREILERHSRAGTAVDYTRDTTEAFRQKGWHLGNKIKELDAAQNYEFFIPLDCDEFLVLQHGPTMVEFAQAAIQNELQLHSGSRQALSVNSAYYNVLGRRDHFWCWKHTKTFFAAETFVNMDRGFHTGETFEGGRRDTRLSHIHYHHKPYQWMVEHSKNKLRPFMNVDDPAELKKAYATNRLAKFVLDPEAEYLKRFDTNKTIVVDGFSAYVESLGSRLPY
jgi:hypothetical protein